MDSVRNKPRVLLLRMARVPFIDATGEANLRKVVTSIQQEGGVVLIAGIAAQPKAYLKKSGLAELIGEEHYFEHTGDAISYSLSLLNHQKCLGCKHFAFRECRALCGEESLETAVV